MKVVVWCTIFVVALFEGKYARALAEDESGHYVNEVAVLLDGDETVADLVAGTHGFTVKRKVSVVYFVQRKKCHFFMNHASLNCFTCYQFSAYVTELIAPFFGRKSFTSIIGSNTIKV